MNEIEKLYENANIEPKYIEGENLMEYSYGTLKYPQFTAEKQLKIVKCILFSKWWMNLKRLQFAENFKEALAGLINDLWQDLTEEEKEQIRSVLNGN